MQSCCSYCQRRGHTIRSCGDPSISTNIEHMRDRYDLYHHNRSGSPLSRALFVNYLHSVANLSQIRAIVVRLRIGNASISKTMGIERIYNHFTHQRNITNLSPEPEELTSIAWSIDRTTNIIPTPSYNLVSNPIQTRVSLHNRPQVGFTQVDLGSGFTLADLDFFINDITSSNQELVHRKKMQVKLVSCRDEKSKEFDCPICLECVGAKNSIKLNCAHIFCSTCIEETLKIHQDNINCALCRETVRTFHVQSGEVYELMKNHNYIEVA